MKIILLCCMCNVPCIYNVGLQVELFFSKFVWNVLILCVIALHY